MEEEGNEMQDYGGGNGFFTSPRNMYGSAITTLTNPEMALEEMKLIFKDGIITKDGVAIYGENPLMNDIGINNIMALLKGIVTQNTIMGNIDKNQIQPILEFGLVDTLIKTLMMNRIRFGIKDLSSRDIIFNTVITTCFLTLKRPEGEGDRRFWKGSVQEYRTTVEGGKKDKGILSRMNPWSG